MIITIRDDRGNGTEFYNVPRNVGKAIITILYECENDNNDIISAESEE
jgi:hypothetical protein